MTREKIKVGINGLGRIGRAILRNNHYKEFLDVKVINDINPDAHNLAYTLNYDTLYPSPFKFKVDDTILVSGNYRIAIYNCKNIDEVPWEDHDLDYIIDASGVYENVVRARKILSRKKIKRVFVTHSPDIVDFQLVLGANEEELNLDEHFLISTSICDATAIAPVLKLINDKYKITNGYITTLHPWLSYQNLQDGPASSWSVPGEIYHHYALGRTAIGNMIPKPTTAVTQTCNVLKRHNITEEMIGSFSYRTPTAIVGSADVTLNVATSVTCDALIACLTEYEEKQKWQIIKNNIEPLVSLDFKQIDYSAIVDNRWTSVIGDNLIKVVLWYDNEYGYAGKVVEQVKYVNDLLEG
jgi:glyceraldehyde 3-phosphate dehydrogenase